MELHLPSHRWAHRAPDWATAAVAGFVGGAVLMVLELLWSTWAGNSPWEVSNRIAAMTMGRDALSASGFQFSLIASALITHYVLGIVFGLLLAAAMASLQLESSGAMALLAGLVFGLAIYLIDFYVMVAMFPWFREMRGWITLAGHLIFGMTVAMLYWKMQRGVPTQALSTK